MVSGKKIGRFSVLRQYKTMLHVIQSTSKTLVVGIVYLLFVSQIHTVQFQRYNVSWSTQIVPIANTYQYVPSLHASGRRDYRLELLSFRRIGHRAV